MGNEALTREMERLARQRVTTALVRSFPWHRELNEEGRYLAEERIGMCVGSGPCSKEAWILAKQQTEHMKTDSLQRVSRGEPKHGIWRERTRRMVLWQVWENEARLLHPGLKGRFWRFQCPMCGGVQTMQDFVDLKVTETLEEASKYVHFSCIGRWVPDRGCDWTLGRLLQMHTLEVLREGKLQPAFEWADFEKLAELKGI